MKRIHFALVSLMVVLLVTGCGGGGGSSGGTTIPTAAVQITATNASTVAKGAMTPAQGMAQSGSGMAGVVGVVAQTSGRTRSILDISLAKFAQVRGLQLAPATGVVGVIAGLPMTYPCAMVGSTSISIQDVNNNATFDVGDVLTMSLSNCDDGVSTTSGSLTFAITSLSGVSGLMGGTGTALNPLTAAFTLTFSNFSKKDNTTNLVESINGDISFSTSDDGTNTTGTMSGTSLSMNSSVDGPFQMTSYNFSFTEANVPTVSTPYSFLVTMTTASVTAGGSITITTPTPFTGVGSGNPTAGVMVITGANNSTLTLTANADGTHVGMVVDDDGVGGPNVPQTLADTTWAAI